MELSYFPLSSWGHKSETGLHTWKSLEQKLVLIAISLQVDKKKCISTYEWWRKYVYQHTSVVLLDPSLDSGEKSHFVNGHIFSSRTVFWDSLHPQEKPSWPKWPWIVGSRPFFGILASIVNSHGLSGIILRPHTEQYANSFALCFSSKVTSIHFNIQKYVWEIKVLTEIDQKVHSPLRYLSRVKHW